MSTLECLEIGLKKISANSIQDHCKYWDTSSGAQLKGFGALRPSSLDVCT